ncbi:MULTISPECIES: hypothetical protein [Thiomicrorhabdus]|uniref:CDP-Glycerol:Poly(Glycerophosphate) glycerophosphotransferase n=1 Tax=Thiomicrorhabdus heinhorstiae TaxID=2748010 RepID=A0ABS0C3E9_9GAMM|nr:MULTISPECIES: hypothetical protein [Thiomicrorhabdus]MBF6058666.1 hypothetical protein [Thiomicrorhabdus heinhorstiae]
MSPLKRILVSARDPASLQAVQQLLPALAQQYSVRLWLQSPAFDIWCEGEFQVEGIEVEQVTLKDWSDGISKERWLKESALRDKLQACSPDLVLTGVSGPGVGVDEALLLFSRELGIASLALQTFWGGFNSELDALPDYALVIDDGAVQMNAATYPEITCFAVGSLRHAPYQSLDVEARRAELRNDFPICNKTLVLWLGQPLWQVEGYLKTQQVFADFLHRKIEETSESYYLLYRAHPKEDSEQVAVVHQLLQDSIPGCWQDVSKHSFVDCLLLADMVVSCFSSGGFDNVCLNEKTTQPFSSTLYLFFDPTIREWFHRYSHLEEIPVVSEEFALAVTSKEQFADRFAEAMDDSVRLTLGHNAKLHLPPADYAVEKSMEVICRLMT